MVAGTLPVRVKVAGEKLTLSQKHLKVSAARDSRVEWVAEEGTLELRFVDAVESPFESAAIEPVEGGRVLRAPRLRAGLVPGSSYPYELVLKRGAMILGRIRGVIVIDPGAAGSGRSVLISITREGKLEVSPEYVTVNRKKAEQVDWTCNDGSFEIAFNKNGTPFPEERYDGMKSLVMRSGKCKGDAEEKTHNYTVTVWPASGGDSISIDPGVVVEDDGGDGR